MRDPNRIEPFLQELGTIWKEECPDWRFGQFIVNVFGSGSLNRDPFFIDDKDMLRHVRRYFRRDEKKEENYGK